MAPRQKMIATDIAELFAHAKLHHERALALMEKYADPAYYWVIASEINAARTSYLAALVATGKENPVPADLMEITLLGRAERAWLDNLSDEAIVALACGKGFPPHLTLMVSKESLRWWLQVTYGDDPRQAPVLRAAERHYAEKYPDLVFGEDEPHTVVIVATLR
ncbi:hypothetical protein [Streptosporangium sp. NPDC002524]|uniref:hypothetical protein n=1 Tax=Streptosporangium sp. NPDC002524 TaxID=3154537 RepID=UPI0033225168